MTNQLDSLLLSEPLSLLKIPAPDVGLMLLERIDASQKDERTDFFRGIRIPGGPEVSRVVAEGWAWLESEGLIAKEPKRDVIFVTRKGRTYLESREREDSYLSSRLLPRDLVHPSLEAQHAAFLRGDFADAVFQAFRLVEVEVREAAGFGSGDLGTDLMRQAFREQTGPLTDPEEETSEQQSLAHLFAGAIGRFKNPGSHRIVHLRAQEAAELLVFASYLMRIVDACQRRHCADDND